MIKKITFVFIVMVFIFLGCEEPSVTNEDNSQTNTTTNISTNTNDVETNISTSEFLTSVSSADNSKTYYDANDIPSGISFTEFTINLSDFTAGDLTDNVSISGDSTEATITSTTENKIKYILSGAMTGTLTITSDSDFAVLLNGVTINAESGKALDITESSKAFIILQDGTTNTFTDSSDGKKACVYSAGPIIIDGTGTLIINGNKKHSLQSDNYIRILNGIIKINSSVQDGIRALNKFIFDDGDLTIKGTGTEIDSESKGIKVEGSEDSTENSSTAGLGYIVINGGKISINTISKAITASWDVTEDGDTLSTSTYEPNPFVMINNGVIDITTTGTPYEYYDNDNNKINLSPEGIEGKSSVIINNGYITISTTDDAINAGSAIEINGGYVYAYSSGNDAIDSNGTLKITGGYTVAIATTTPECAFDSDSNAPQISGGYLVGIGTSNYSAPTTSSCSQNTFIISSSYCTAGCTMALVDSSNNCDFAFTIPSGENYDVMILSSPAISSSTNYTLMNGVDASSDSVFEGMYIGDIDIENGQSVTTCTTSTKVTQLGTISNGGAAEGEKPGQPR